MSKITTPAMEKFLKNNKNIKSGMRKHSPLRDSWLRLKRNRTAIFGLVIIILLVLVAIFAGVITQYEQQAVDIKAAKQTPNAQHWFGTDTMGRDIFTRCLYGARYSLSIGVSCMILALMLGGGLGFIAAFFGRSIDIYIMRIMDIISAVPSILMAVVVVASLGNGVPQLVVALTISFMPSMAKTVRAAVLTCRQSEYIEVARCIGANNLRVMFRHILPNALGLITISTVNSIAGCILTISTLSYIGLGLAPPIPEWGALLAAGRDNIMTFPHMVLFPGLMIMITILGFNTFGDGLRDALDPRLK